MKNLGRCIVSVLLLVLVAGIAEAGTIGYWEFNEGADPTVLDDLSGNGNHGAVTATNFYNGDGTATFSGDDVVVVEGDPDGDSTTPGIFDVDEFIMTMNFQTTSGYSPTDAMALMGTRQVNEYGFLSYIGNVGGIGAGGLQVWMAPIDTTLPEVDSYWYRLKLPAVMEADHDYTMELGLISGTASLTLTDNTDSSVDTVSVSVGNNYRYYPGADLYIGDRGADGWNNLKDVAISDVEIVPEPTTMILLGIGSTMLLRRKKYHRSA